MRIRGLALFSLLLVVLTACTYGRDPWRLQKTTTGWAPQPLPNTPIELKDPKHPPAALASQTWEQFDAYDVGIVEFKDDGSLWSEEQQRLVLDRIRSIVAKDAATIVVYAHGWHHNAKFDDDNLISFRKVLATIAAQRHIGMTCGVSNPDKNRVVGVYIGWRGESSKNNILTWLTIWDRKRTAQRIGDPSTTLEEHISAEARGLPKLLQELDDIKTTANNSIQTANRRFTSITIVGHSLGGAMLLSAMQQIVFDNKRPQFAGAARPLQKGVGDLVVLLNPAVEARRYGFFESVVAPGATFDPAQAPVLVTISSKGDWPNKWPFWIARFITTLYTPTRWYEPARSTVNLGFLRKWRTHELDIPVKTATELESKKILVFEDADLYPQKTNPLSPPMHLADSLTFWHGEVTFTKRDDIALNSDAPFLIVQGTREIIHGHNDIFSNRLLAFLLPYATATERKRVHEFCASHIGPSAVPTAATQ
jgi:hypothetical protein